jgi:hypothetical protein
MRKSLQGFRVEKHPAFRYSFIVPSDLHIPSFLNLLPRTAVNGALVFYKQEIPPGFKLNLCRAQIRFQTDWGFCNQNAIGNRGTRYSMGEIG